MGKYSKQPLVLKPPRGRTKRKAIGVSHIRACATCVVRMSFVRFDVVTSWASASRPSCSSDTQKSEDGQLRCAMRVLNVAGGLLPTGLRFYHYLRALGYCNGILHSAEHYASGWLVRGNQLPLAAMPCHNQRMRVHDLGHAFPFQTTGCLLGSCLRVCHSGLAFGHAVVRQAREAVRSPWRFGRCRGAHEC